MIGRNAAENWLVTGLDLKKPEFHNVKIADESYKVVRVRWHPTFNSHALALVRKPNAKANELYLSKDGGKTWGSGPVRAQIIDAQFGSPDASEYNANKLHGLRLTDDNARYFFEFDINELNSFDIKVDNAHEFFHMNQFLFVATVNLNLLLIIV